MNNKDFARRATAEVSFDGVDITKSIRPYLLSLTYTDNEEDETDDLQIKLQDREGLWMCEWLNDVIEVAASTVEKTGSDSTSETNTSSSSTYTVTATELNIRSGPGTSYSILGTFKHGETITVSAIENNWATISYNSKTAYVSANYIQAVSQSQTIASNTTTVAAQANGASTNQTYINYAIEMQSRYGCPASVMLGQFVYESASGTSHLAQVANNCFGIKGTGPAGSYKSSSGSTWRKYNNKKESFEDYAKLVTNSRYSKYTGNSKDPETFLKGLVKGGYCPDAGYVSAVMKIIKNYGFTKYDSAVPTTISSSTSSSSTNKNAKDIVDIAISQLGQKGGKPFWSYLGFKSRVKWCQCFVSWCAGQAGMSTNICPKTASTTDGMNWFKQRGLFKYKGSYTPKRGDWIYFKTGASHVGLVEYSANGKVYTVEGNASDMVKRNSYSLKNGTITGYGTPKYPYLNDGTTASAATPTSGSTTATTDSSTSKKAANSNRITKLKIQAVIVRENWNSDGKDDILDCGIFELDSIDASGPPATVTIKATSLPYKAQIRQTEKSKAWESYYLSGIVTEMTAKAGMTCMYLSDKDPYYERVEQYKTSDISFLSTLCHDAGISLKATNQMLVLFDQATYESKESILTIQKGTKAYEKYKLNIETADKQYQSCRVRYTNPNGVCISGIAYADDYNEDSEDNQQLEVTAKVASIAEATELAEKHLRLHNKYSRTANFTLPGNPALVAGVNFQLSGWGAWDGKYIISQAVHSIGGGSGYTTQIRGRRVLEGY